VVKLVFLETKEKFIMEKFDSDTAFYTKCRLSFSADKISNGEESVRGIIEFRGKHYVCTNKRSEELHMTEVSESRYFNDNPHHYHDHNWNTQRTYNGVRFKYQGSWWVFLCNEIVITLNRAKDAPNKQTSLMAFLK